MGPVGKLFSPSTPKLPEPVAVPSRAESAQELSAASEEEKQRLKKQRGRANTRLSGAGILGDDAAASPQATGGGLATKTLLGG